MENPVLQELLSRIEAWNIQAESDLPDTLLPVLESEEARQALAEVIIDLFQRWHLQEPDQAALLGRRDKGEILQQNILPREPKLLQRVGHLLGIARALKELYPYTPAARDHWVWRVNSKLANRMPLEVMLTEGLPGIRRIRTLLEKAVRTGQLL